VREDSSSHSNNQCVAAISCMVDQLPMWQIDGCSSSGGKLEKEILGHPPLPEIVIDLLLRRLQAARLPHNAPPRRRQVCSRSRMALRFHLQPRPHRRILLARLCNPHNNGTRLHLSTSLITRILIDHITRFLPAIMLIKWSAPTPKSRTTPNMIVELQRAPDPPLEACSTPIRHRHLQWRLPHHQSETMEGGIGASEIR
jgi:hypothetical protein